MYNTHQAVSSKINLLKGTEVSTPRRPSERCHLQIREINFDDLAGSYLSIESGLDQIKGNILVAARRKIGHAELLGQVALRPGKTTRQLE